MVSDQDAKAFMQEIVKQIELADMNEESTIDLDEAQVQKLYTLFVYLLDTKFFDEAN